MNTLKFISVSLILLVTVLLTSCEDKATYDVPCTPEIVTIQVTIKDGLQQAIALDSFAVTNKADGSDVTIMQSTAEFEYAQQHGIYPLLIDGGLAKNTDAVYVFKGIIDNNEIVSSEYAVAADDCHVRLVSGNLDLIVE